MENQIVTVSLPLDKMNVIMMALGEMPYKNSAAVIQEIQAQVQPQIQPPEPANDNKED